MRRFSNLSPYGSEQRELFSAQSAGVDGVRSFELSDAAFSSALWQKGMTFAKLTTALPVDGVGDLKALVTTGIIGVTADEAGNGKGVAPGNPTLTVDAAHSIGAINTNGDQDYYQVTLEAGKTYQIGMYGYTGPAGSPGPTGAPLVDSYIEIYRADGTSLVVSADGGADTPHNAANSGFDVLLTFTPDTTGTYYINAQSFDNNAADGTTGEGVGDYEIFVHDATNDPTIYRPYYDVDSPLYAIDWGTRVNRVNQTAANPDGNEGPRDTGNAQGTPTYGSALDMNAILAANGKTAADIVGKNVITIYFAKAGEVVTSLEDPSSPGLPPVAVQTSDVSDFEHAAVMTALHQFEKVADVVYLEVQSRDQADFEYASYKGTPGPGISLLGSMSPPDEPDEGLALFNSGDYRWNATDLQQGGFSFVTLIHELGHGHGLAHPHDNGGHSGIMHGVEPEGAGVADYTTGDYHLNQGVFTMMSYEDGWQDSPYGNAPTTGGYGYLGGLMAFDIAAIQDKYGVNEDWATGNDTYTIKDENAPGTFYTSIWDAGGIDQIVYNGTRDANIDLRPATLKYEEGGGGWVSYAYGIYGGFTVANGVTIENATSGAGNDQLWGNAANNVMTAGAGNDRILLQDGGNDTAYGGDGNDYIYFGGAYTSDDVIDGGAGTDTVGLIGTYSSLSFGAGSLNGIERLALYTSSYLPGSAPAAYNITFANHVIGTSLFVTAASLQAGETLTFNGTAETTNAFYVHGGAGNDAIAGGGGSDYLIGNAGNDQLYGLGGIDTLVGGGGADILRGGVGGDFFRYESVTDSTASATDKIVDFEGFDKIDLSAIDANSGVDGNQAFTFIGASAFSGAGQLRATFDAGNNLWTVEGDVNGDGTADFVLQVVSLQPDPLNASHFVL
ncbi:MAG: M10 family metallopeptidase C-terminal domain-containing protein [Alphaproteobacteria bacterium]|nr:M10 family metallopeptidase C-terminal domain-containing protein [Alphaproteobacteria bacterium]MBV9371795.1 M10 family metallopeptidase C-terminal domain-containing protein [Alphaproteobacteria bacterium]MBV9901920.1 M10 family metallopeptidase C-terminal domain-containing protein [Alphaproteobacteria bacterium]